MSSERTKMNEEERPEANPEPEPERPGLIRMTGAVVVRGSADAIERLFRDVMSRTELKVVYVKAAGCKLRIMTEESP